MRSSAKLVGSLLILSACVTVTPPSNPSAVPTGSQHATKKKDAPVMPVTFRTSELKYSFDERGLVTKTIHDVYETVSASPPSWLGEVSMAYQPGLHAMPTLVATVTSPTGKVTSLDPKTLSDGPDTREDSTYSDWRVLRAPLPNLVPGSVVERTTTRSATQEWVPGAGMSLGIVMDMPFAVGQQRFVVEAPAALGVTVQGENTVAPQRTTLENGRVQYVFDFGTPAAIEHEEHAVPTSAIKRRTVWISTAKDWTAVAAAYAKAVGPLTPSAALTEQVRTATRGATTRTDKVNALITWIHRSVRYTQMNLGDGALVPRPADETLKRGYGDCKDLAVLLITALKTLDIDAQLALLNTEFPDANPSAPGLGTFNHAIVALPGSTLGWVDVTDPFGGLDVLPADDQARHALLINPQSKGLVVTPSSTSRDNLVTVAFDIQMAEDGPARIKRTLTASPRLATALRSEALRQPEVYEQNVVKTMERGYQAKDLTQTHSDPRLAGRPFVSTQEFTSETSNTYTLDASSTLATSAVYWLLPFSLEEEKDEDGVVQHRKQPLEFEVPGVTELSWQIHPPPGYVVSELPAPSQKTFGPLTISQRFVVDGDDISVRLRLDTGAKVYSAADVELVKQGLTEFMRDVPTKVEFDNDVSKLIKLGRVTQALERAQQLTAKFPRSANMQAALANAYLSVRAMERAKAAAEKAIELNPKLAESHRILSSVLAHDAWGELMTRTADRQGSLREALKTLELEPKQVAYVDWVVRLYQYNDAWEWHGPGCDLAKALQVVENYRTATEATEEGTFDDEYAQLLFLLGKYQQLSSLDSKLKLTRARAAYSLAADAILEGDAKALATWRRNLTNKEDRSAVSVSAYSHLLGARKYELAHAVLSDIARSAGNEAAMVKYQQVFANLRPVPAVASPKDPKSVFAEYMRWFLSARGTTPLFEPPVDPDQLEALHRLGRQTLAQIGKREGINELSADLGVDFTMASCEWSIEPAAPLGEILVCRNAVQGTTLRTLMVKRGGALRIHQGGYAAAHLGTEALAAIERGDTANARAWLELTRRFHEGRPKGFDAVLERAEQDPELLRISASMLIVVSKEVAPDRGLAILEAAMTKETKPKRREQLRNVLVAGYLVHDLGPKLVTIAHEFEDSEEADLAALFTYRGLMLTKQYGEALLVTRKMLTLKQDDADWLESAASAAAADQKFDVARGLLDRLIAKKGDNATALNNRAWYSLYTAVTAADVSQAERATTLSKNANPAELGTLAALYAEVGRTDDALKTLTLMSNAESEAFEDGHSSRWYTLGRIAEALKLNDEARRHYQRVIPNADKDPTSDLSSLAKRRLSSLSPSVK